MQSSVHFWDKIAERYATKPVADEAAYRAKLELTKARLSSQDSVLDLGCGTGSLALELSPLVAQVHSVDSSGAMIRIGERKAEAAGMQNVTFHEASLEALPPFEPESFAMVCAYNILHLVEDRDAVLREAFRLLRPGGHFVSSTAVLGESLIPYTTLIALMRLLGKAPRAFSFSVVQLEASLAAAGFVEVERHPVSSAKTLAFHLARKPG